MCGIFATFSADKLSNDEEALINSLGRLEHRGPDNTGYWSDEKVFLGHTRLSILDTSPSGHQPFFFEDLAIIYNGEVFNFIELRDELRSLGYDFQSTSDTEVVLKAYHAYGVECFAKFNGMWSLCIYNKRTEELVVSRDRFGQKPLFYNYENHTISLASELSALFRIKKTGPNFEAISSFLKEGDFNVAQNTFFNGFFEFPAAHFAVFKKGCLIESVRYWQYPSFLKSSEGDVKDKFHQLLEDAVKIRLRTDVDYSVLLSGGCDSTIISGIMRNFVPEKRMISSYTFSSQDEDDESEYAAEIARHLNMKSITLTNSEKFDAIRSRLLNLVVNLGRGHSSPAILSVEALYRRVNKDGFKVIIDGQGADELLAGYKHYHLHLIIDMICQFRWRELPPILRDVKSEGLFNIVIMALRNSLPRTLRTILRRIYGYEGLFTTQNKNRLQSATILSEPEQTKIDGAGFFHKYLLGQHQIGLKNLLYYGDIVSMSTSIENRSPFMDHRLVELAFASSDKLHVKGASDKAVLRSHSVYMRFRTLLERKKVGFNSPLDRDIKKNMIAELSKSDILNWPIINKSKLRDYIDNGKFFEIKFERLLFRLYQVHLWDLIYNESAK